MGGEYYDRSDYSSGSGRSSSYWEGSSSSSGSGSSRSSSGSAPAKPSRRESDGTGGGGREATKATAPKRSNGYALTEAADLLFRNSQLNTAVFPRGRELVCTAQTGIVIALDLTGSNKLAVGMLWDKFPMLYGQIKQKKYLKDFAISLAGVGDVNSDRAPVQVCDFAQGTELDKHLTSLYLEGGGGYGSSESYELTALYYLRHSSFTHPGADKPYFFFVGDEGFYEGIRRDQVKSVLGDKDQEESSAIKILKDLQEKFNVFMIHIPYAPVSDPADPEGLKVVSSYPSEDRKIVDQWRNVLGQNFMSLDEPKGFVDVILGCVALQSQTRTLDQYLSDMKRRKQTEARIGRVEKALRPKADALAKVAADLAALPNAPDKTGNSQRI